jgi:hypothetical protein
VCSQEALVNKTDKEIEVLDIGDKSLQNLLSTNEQTEVSAVFGNSS